MYLIDVSNNNGTVDFHAAYRAGVRGVWAKASEGASFVDAFYRSNVAAARLAGLRPGAYHFARPGQNTAVQEAEHFCSVVGKPGRRDLRPVLDLEDIATTGLHPVELVAWAHRFCQRVEGRCGTLPLFYANTSDIETLRAVAPIGAGLWLANYNGTNDVAVPAPWKHLAAHQYTDRFPVAGKTVDRSWAPRLRPLLAHPVLGLV